MEMVVETGTARSAFFILLEQNKNGFRIKIVEKADHPKVWNFDST